MPGYRSLCGAGIQLADSEIAWVIRSAVTPGLSATFKDFAPDLACILCSDHEGRHAADIARLAGAPGAAWVLFGDTDSQSLQWLADCAMDFSNDHTCLLFRGHPGTCVYERKWTVGAELDRIAGGGDPRAR